LSQYQVTGASVSEVAASVEAAVAAGRLLPGERLLSVRALAAELGLSPTTVAGAMAQLRRRGVVVSEPRRGTRVSPRPPLRPARLPSAVPSGLRNLADGNPDPALLPALGPALDGLDPPPRLYGDESAVPELLALARRRLERDGVPAADLCVVSGALDGVERVLSAHLAVGDRVALEDPGYTGLIDLVRALGLTPEPVAIDDRGALPAALARQLGRVRAAILTPRAQNPTGAAFDAERAAELRAVLAGAPDVLVVEDDHLGPVAGTPAETTTTGRERWAVVRSVAKSLGPDVRLALLAGDPRTVARVEGRQLVGPGWVSHMLQRLVVALWSSRETRALLRRAEATYARRRAALVGALRERGVEASGRSGLNVWVPVAEEAGPLRALLAAGWAVAAGEPYRLDSGPALRITVATLEPDEADRLADELAAVLSPPARTRAA
jgi:DNA-binding transcriptional MocR family regulator